MLLYISFKRKKTFFRALQPITTTLLLVEPFREKPTIHTTIFLHNFHSIARGLGKGVVPQLIRIDIQAANIYTTIIRVPLIARTYDVQRTRSTLGLTDERRGGGGGSSSSLPPPPGWVLGINAEEACLDYWYIMHTRIKHRA